MALHAARLWVMGALAATVACAGGTGSTRDAGDAADATEQEDPPDLVAPDTGHECSLVLVDGPCGHWGGPVDGVWCVGDPYPGQSAVTRFTSHYYNGEEVSPGVCWAGGTCDEEIIEQCAEGEICVQDAPSCQAVSFSPVDEGTPESFCRTLDARRCEIAWACGMAVSVAACRDDRAQSACLASAERWWAARDRGGLALDAAAFEACLARAHDTCAPDVVSGCLGEASVPARTEGEACLTAAECTGGTCVPEDAACGGLCGTGARLTEGAACETSADCAPGLHCRGWCAAPLPAGHGCADEADGCEPGAFCSERTCRTAEELAESCPGGELWTCRVALECSATTCFPRLVVYGGDSGGCSRPGAVLSPSLPRLVCRAGLVCREDGGCEAPLGAACIPGGEDCGLLACDPVSATCAPLPTEGAPCPLPGEGEDRGASCAFPAVCVAEEEPPAGGAPPGRCVTRAAYGAPCTRPDDCRSGVCDGGACGAACR